MSQPTTLPRATPPSPDNVGYGWRMVAQLQPDGSLRSTLLALTQADLLHPEEGDEVTHAEPHERCSVYLYDVFRARLAGRPDAVVLKDVRISWDVEPPLRPHGPDLMVILGIRESKPWSTFDVATEGVRPDLIVEVTSPETRTNDLVHKPRHYRRAKVPLYVIVDGATENRQLRVIGFELVNGRYRRRRADGRGRLWLEPVRVWLGVVGEEIVCFDEQDEPISDFTTQLTARLAAETRVRLLEAELRRLRGEPEPKDQP